MLITYIALKFEVKNFRDIGLVWERKTLLKFIGGLTLGFIIFSLIIAAIVIFTSLTVTYDGSANLWSALVVSSLALLPQAWMEEIAFRAYTLRLLKKAYGVRFSIYVGALAFAMYHFVPGGNLLGCLLGTGVWGIVYGYLAIRSGGIAFPLGLHLALNLLQAVMGMKEPYTHIWELIEETMGRSYFNFDVELIGLLSQIVILIVSVILIEVSIRKGKI